MPRFGKQFKVYNRILPSLFLDVTDIIEDCEFRQLLFLDKADTYIPIRHNSFHLIIEHTNTLICSP